MRESILQTLRVGLTRWLAARVAVLTLGTLGALTLGAVLLDAALDLPEAVRAAAPWLLGAVLVVALAAAVWEWRRVTEMGVARRFERMDASLGNRLTNAVHFAPRTGTTPIEEFLRGESVALGRQAAATLQAWPVVRRRFARASAFVGCVAGAWLALLAAGNELAQAVLPRFADPHGDHPPYSRLKIEVAPGRAEVLYGGQVEIRATTRGRPVDKLWLVARAGTNVNRAIMFLAPDKSFFQTLVNLREPTEYFVSDGTARSRRFPVAIRYTPQITLVEVTEDFPEYTSKPSRTAKLSGEPQALPEGTRVSFRVASNRPLKSGALELTPVLGGKAITVPLQPEGAQSRSSALRGPGGKQLNVPQPPAAQSTIVTGAFTFAEAVAFNLSVRDVGGLDCAEPRRGRLNLLPDERPRLFVQEPGRNAVAAPGIRVPVRIQASDDYAVSRVVWLRGLNRSIERPFSMKLTLKDGARSVEADGSFALDQLGVRPGDVIDYYFEAADNYPKGPNVTFSRPFRLEIISKEQYEAILRQAAARKALFEPYFRLDAWLRRLAELARHAEAKSQKADPAARAEADDLDKQLEQFQQELGKLLQEPLMFDVDQSFSTTLAAQHTRLGETSSKLKRALGSSQLDPKQMKEISDELTQMARTQDEAVEQPAQQIAAVVRVLARADTFVKLAQQQAVLAQLLQRFADRTNALSRLEQMEVQELAHQERRVEEGLRTLLAQLPELLAAVPAGPDYEALRSDVDSFIRAVADAKIEEYLRGAANALDEPDTMTGHALAQLAAELMDKLIAKCNGLPNQAAQCLTARFQPKLSKPGVGNSVQQILAAMGAGNGQGGRDGYALFNEDVALYGPNVELAGEQAGRRGDTGRSASQNVARVGGEASDMAPAPPNAPGRVRLQPDARFPLRYRDLVGEYFRVIAESEQEGNR